jgi:hypothetical protein
VFEEIMKELDDICENTDPRVKLAVTQWVLKNVVKHAEQGGSFRHFIYTSLGFGPEAYVPLYEAGGMTISNEFDLKKNDTIKEIVKENKYEKLKPLLGFCDSDDCYKEISCGWPDGSGKYRNTCSEHYRGSCIPIEDKMTDIVEKLTKYLAGMGTRNPKDYTTFLTAEDAAEAKETIENLRVALRKIGYDYVELSYEKVNYLYLEHMMIARNAYQNSFPEEQPTERKPFDDNF